MLRTWIVGKGSLIMTHRIWYGVVKLTVVVIWSLDILNETISVDGDIVAILLEVELDHSTITEVILYEINTQCMEIKRMPLKILMVHVYV